jgi:uncharacterized protein (UPF0332 family)
MSFDWNKFIELAKNLHLQKTEECFRTAISRVYFGIFCIIRNYKGYKGYKKSNVHSKVIEALITSEDPNEQEIRKMLDELRRVRNLADYDEDKNINEEFSKRCILKANEILRMIMIK